MTAVAAALVFCAGATMARTEAPIRLATPEPAAPTIPRPAPPLRLAQFEPAEPATTQPAPPLRLAALDPADLPIQHTAPSISHGPFGLSVTDGGAMSARWRSLQPAISTERHILALCRSNPAICPSPAAKFIAIVEAARARNGHARIGEVNRAINLAIRPMSDLAQYGVPDLWASPLMTFASGAGDCEDYAIAKYVALLETGTAADDLRLVVAHDRTARQDHMVAAARIDGRWLILDNRIMRLLADSEVPDLTPLLALGGESETPVPTIAAIQQPQPAESAQGWDTAGFTVAL